MALIEETFDSTILKKIKDMKFIDPALPEKEL
jgi:hypothetical protein